MRFGPDSLRSRLARGDTVIATFVGIGHAAAVEVMGWRGFEAVCIDSEHASLGPATIESMVRAADASGTEAIVRVAAIGPELGRALDVGACGVLVPHVDTAEQARQCAAAVRYPPVGERGAGPGRVTAYAQNIASYLGQANDNVTLMVQVETALGVQNAAEIAAVDGVDVIFVGPGDLAVSLGVAPGSEPHTAAISEVLKTAQDAGKVCGIFCLTAAAMAPWVEAGVRFFLIGSDLGLLGEAAQAQVAQAREAVGQLERSGA